jgi:alpha-galactosidase
METNPRALIWWRGIATIAAMLAFCPSQADESYSLDGAWIVESVSPQGYIPQIVEFSKDTNGISGIWTSRPKWKDQKIGGVTVRGASITFRVGSTADFRGALWQGRFVSRDVFVMRWMGENGVFGSDGVPIWSRTFRRASRSTLAALEADAPKDLITRKLPLPALRELASNGLALTPPMGWNSWNTFQDTIDDKTVREIADALVASGLRDVGYVYVNIDDGWQGRRDAHGILQPNSKFPDMRGLADYVHAKGLKFGLYTVAGPISCVDKVGSHGYEEQDAGQFAKWGADFVKVDWCSAGELYSFDVDGRAIFQKMGEALRETGRPMVYSICTGSRDWGLKAGVWGHKAGGNLWRTSEDSFVGNRWGSLSVRFDFDGVQSANGPGGWNDPDILLVGLQGLTVEENRTHMTLWSMLAAPLLLGNDIRRMSDAVSEILMNREVIAIDQDALGKQGRRAVKNGETEIWTKPLADGSTAIALFNRGAMDAEISANWSDLGLHGPQRVRDLWRHQEYDEGALEYRTVVPTHGSVLLRVAKASKAP